VTKQTITTIEFHGATLLALQGEKPETTFVAMRPMVEGMGLDWAAQFTKIKAHSILGSCVAIIPTQMPSDNQVREHVFLPLNRLHGWLMLIYPNKVPDPAVRAKVIEYQTEAFDVLFNHFFGQNAQPLGGQEARPFDRFGPEELNARLGAVRQATRLWGRAAGSWTWEAADLPVPPRKLLPAWAQQEMPLHDPTPVVTVTISQQPGGSGS